MAKKTPPGGPAYSGSPSAPVASERELIVVAAPQAGLRATGEAVASVAGADVTSLNSVLSASGATLIPVFGNEDRVARTMSFSTMGTAAADLPEMTSYYRVVADDDKLDQLASKLLENDVVEAAYVKPPMEPPVIFEDAVLPPNPQEAPPVTPNFNARQIYLDAAPAGIDARFAATVNGGKGQGVRIIDIEGAWRFSHEDLVQNQGGVVGGTQSGDIGWRNHGTAVTGEFGGDDNAFGITGICPLANVRAISIFGAGQGSAKAITDAANALSAGDIILIELHAPGPHFNFQTVSGQRGYIAMEFWPDNFAAIVYATSVRGVIVVEAAGNGSENFDDPLYNNRPTGFPTTWRNPFNLANPQSGAVIVGAGAPPPGTHGRNHGADRSRLDFSNWGARVDVQGWGREVTTTGYGDLQGGGNEDLWYTDVFSGTSSASPIVVGAVGCMQGALRAASKPLLTPATARNILRTTGSAQQDEPGRPATQRIGNRPNLRQALTQLGVVVKGKEIHKEVIKEKDFIKDKAEKLEIKEIKEHKDKDKEKLEIKEIKDKEIKELVKEIRDKLRDKFTDKIREIGPQAGGPSSSDLESRLGALEQAVGELTHFIASELRPDLQSSALSQEQDLVAISQQLQQQANDAKSMKDQKDIEKVRET
ncbi:MAG: S8 family serine peptidase [Acidobacteriota bacterium]